MTTPQPPHAIPTELASIQAVLFDLDRTLRFSSVMWEELAVKFLWREQYQQTPPDEVIHKARRWSNYYFGSNLVADDQTQYGEELFWEIFHFRFTGELFEDEQIAHELGGKLQVYMREQYASDDIVPPETHQTLNALKAHGYRLGLITNRSQPVTDFLPKIGLDGYFEIAISSAEAGCWKPRPEIFWQALETMGVAPETSLYIGDNYFADVRGARNANLVPVLIDPDQIYPEADCLTIRNLTEILPLLQISPTNQKDQ
ncbi:MAG: HAD family hydrolase [Anaerolineaceae bacterium]|nr:HAD family hydrolase [Anaerolineaceae bacterium]